VDGVQTPGKQRRRPARPHDYHTELTGWLFIIALSVGIATGGALDLLHQGYRLYAGIIFALVAIDVVMYFWLARDWVRMITD
jgi:hypothetical protein